MDFIVVFLHDDARLIREFCAILTSELIRGQVSLSLQDLGILSTPRKDDVVSPRGSLPASPGGELVRLSALIERVQKLLLRLTLRHPSEQGPSTLVGQRRTDVLTPRAALMTPSLHHQHAVK